MQEVGARSVRRRIRSSVWSLRRQDTGVLHEPNLAEESLDGRVWNTSDEVTDWKRREAKSKGDTPEFPAYFGDGECVTTNENNESLNADF